MGHPAIIIIVENDDYKVFYNKWLSHTLLSDVFWGPNSVKKIIPSSHEFNASSWRGDRYLDGGALLDVEKKQLLIFGEGGPDYDVPLRRLYLKLITSVWGDWNITWAHQGEEDFLAYLALSNEYIQCESREPKVDYLLNTPKPLSWTDCAGSFRSKVGELKVFPVACFFEDVLLAGKQLVSQCESAKEVEILLLDEWLKDGFPTSGFHVDCMKREFHFWVSDSISGLLNEVRRLWGTWDVIWHRDRFEFQLEVTEGRIRFPNQSQDAKVDLLIREMMQTNDSNVVKEINRIAVEKGDLSQDSSLCDRNAPEGLSESEKKKILAFALKKLISE